MSHDAGFFVLVLVVWCVGVFVGYVQGRDTGVKSMQVQQPHPPTLVRSGGTWAFDKSQYLYHVTDGILVTIAFKNGTSLGLRHPSADEAYDFAKSLTETMMTA